MSKRNHERDMNRKQRRLKRRAERSWHKLSATGWPFGRHETLLSLLMGKTAHGRVRFRPRSGA